MRSTENCVLTINGGSSSIKFALFAIMNPLQPLFRGQVAGIGSGNTTLAFNDLLNHQKSSFSLKAAHHNYAANFLINWLQKQEGLESLKLIGHRIVYGMQYTQPELITDSLLAELQNLSAFDPEHMPEEISLVEVFRKRYPQLPQIACFDTAFHTVMPPVAKLLPVPRRYRAMGIQRYGFHGLSYAYLMEELKRLAGNETAGGKIILAHLGNGASLAAVKNGQSMDTSMGFTPSSGLPMGSRTGDLDPGVAWYLMQSEKLNPLQFSHLINHQSGLLGISETSADMRDLLQRESTDTRAAEAIELFCYQTRKWIGAYAAVLGGLDTMVFSGGIGENAAPVRGRICNGLRFLGVETDENKNSKNESVISTGASKVTVRVIPTNEELMIAKLSCRVSDKTINK